MKKIYKLFQTIYNRVDQTLLWPLFSLLMVLKYGYHQFKYFPVLDDWIQYGSYPLASNIFKDIILAKSTYMTRPLASLSDPYIWGQLWNHMGISFMIITLLHGLSAFFLYRVIKHFKLPVGLPFLLIYGLLPLGSEATYWISASSRLVVGIFFMSLALYLLVGYLKKPRIPYLLGYLLSHLISMGYYEQISILSAFLAFVILVLSFKSLRAKWLVVSPIFNFGLLLVYYKAFSGQGNVAARGQLVQGNYLDHLKEAFDAIAYVFGSVQMRLMKNGFFRGLQVMVEDKRFIYLLLIVISSILAGLVSYKLSRNKASSISRSLWSIGIGTLAFWLPLAINSLLAVIWICNRNVFPSFLGLALILEGLLGLIFRNKYGHMLKAGLVSILCFVFVVVNVSEIDDYKKASLIDHQVAKDMIAYFDEDILAGTRKVMFFGGESSYIDQNSYHHDHIHNVTTSDWAMTGALRAVARDLDIKQVIMQPWAGASFPIESSYFETALILGIDQDKNIRPLEAKIIDDTFIELYTSEGRLFAVLEKTKPYDKYYFHIK